MLRRELGRVEVPGVSGGSLADPDKSRGWYKLRIPPRPMLNRREVMKRTRRWGALAIVLCLLVVPAAPAALAADGVPVDPFGVWSRVLEWWGQVMAAVSGEPAPAGVDVQEPEATTTSDGGEEGPEIDPFGLQSAPPPSDDE